MNMKRIGLAALGLVLGLSIAGARADDLKIENPIAAGWSKCDVGTSVTMVADTDAGTAVNDHVSSTYTLKEKNADGVKIRHVVTVNDTKHEETTTWPAKVNTTDCTDTGKTVDVRAMGKTFKCKVYEAAGVCVGAPAGGPPATVYISDEMVVGVVKVVVHLPEKKDVTMIATSATKPK